MRFARGFLRVSCFFPTPEKVFDSQSPPQGYDDTVNIRLLCPSGMTAQLRFATLDGLKVHGQIYVTSFLIAYLDGAVYDFVGII